MHNLDGLEGEGEMDMNRLKLKIGPHEFEAEGSPEDVQAQLAKFAELVAMVGSVAAATPEANPPASPSGHPAASTPPAPPPTPNLDDTDGRLDKIMNHDDRVVSLTVRARSVDDAVLLLLYGQKVYRNNDSVTGHEVMQGLTVTGQRAARVDKLLEKAARENSVIVIGEHRGKRYRLTNTGLAKARELAGELIALVA